MKGQQNLIDCIVTNSVFQAKERVAKSYVQIEYTQTDPFMLEDHVIMQKPT